MAAFTYLETPVEVTPSTGSWQDIDVSAYVQNASGVVLQVKHFSSSAKYCMFRPKGSIDNPPNKDLLAVTQAHFACGIDANNILQGLIESTGSGWDVFLIGYFSDADCVFFTEPVADSGVALSWTDWDISSLTGGDQALAAILYVTNSSSSSYLNYGVRMKGSTDNILGSVSPAGISPGIVIGVDANEIFQYYKSETNRPTLDLVGYIRSGVSMNVNAVDVTPVATGAWAALPSLGAGVTGGFFQFSSPSVRLKWGVRPTGNAAYDAFRGDMNGSQAFGVSGADGGVVDGWREGASDVILLVGTVVEAAPPVVDVAAIMFGANY